MPPRDETLRALVPGFRVLPLSATGRTVGSDALGLTNVDLDHPEVQKRLDAKKRLSIRVMTPTIGNQGEAVDTASTKESKLDLSDALAHKMGISRANLIARGQHTPVSGTGKLIARALCK